MPSGRVHTSGPGHLLNALAANGPENHGGLEVGLSPATRAPPPSCPRHLVPCALCRVLGPRPGCSYRVRVLSACAVCLCVCPCSAPDPHLARPLTLT